MSLLSTILGGGLGFATGGPIGGLAGLLAGGTSERQSSPKPPQTAATSSPLQQYLAQEAFLRGYQEIMGATPPQNFGVPTPQLGQGQSVGGERDQQANQRGGMGYSPTWGPQQVPGGGGGDGGVGDQPARGGRGPALHCRHRLRHVPGGLHGSGGPDARPTQSVARP